MVETTSIAAQDDFVPFARPDITEEEIEAVVETLRSGWLTTGPNAAALEAEFAAALGGEVECVAVNSATAGLHLALDSLGIKPGDEVIVPTWTFTSTAEVVRYMGADPVIVDVDPITLNLDLDAARAAVTDRTRAIMPVHFAGLTVQRSLVRDLANRHGLSIVEDAAHAFPVRSEGSVVGDGSTDAAVFSFYATKTMTTGEGGMVAVRDPARARRVRTMRLHGISRDVFDRYTSKTASWRYEVVAPGFKYNLTDSAAALGRVQLRRAGAMQQRREAIAHLYSDAFRDLPLGLPAGPSPGDTHAWHLYVVRIGDDAGVNRDEFIEALRSEGIGTSVHFIPLHKHPYWRERYNLTDGQYPVASEQYRHVVSLPIFSSMSDSQVERVVTAVRKVLR